MTTSHALGSRLTPRATNMTGAESARQPRIVIAGSEPELREYLRVALPEPKFSVHSVENCEELFKYLENAAPPALVMLDVISPNGESMTVLRAIRRRCPTVPVLVLSSVSSAADLEEVMEGGASSCLTKPISYEALMRAVEAALRMGISTVRGDASLCGSKEPTLGAWSRRIETVLAQIGRSDVPVLLTGETGSGKEVLARRIHVQSLRANEVFLKLNCAALPSELVESELFGYERGAFTGAFKSTPGKFELAHRGTILLDEIGDMDLKLQAKLLQVLQDQEFLPLGAKETTRVDVRIIAATHRDLEAKIAEGSFREDLYYRLKVLTIMIPPLRERKDEIIPFALSFLDKYNRPGASAPEMSSDLSCALLNHQWPGNIRELENLMRSYLVLRDPDAIIEQISSSTARAARRDVRVMNDERSSRPGSPTSFLRREEEPALGDERWTGPVSSLHVPEHAGAKQAAQLARLKEEQKEAESELILKALNSAMWNRKRAARILGIDYRALLYKMRTLGIIQSHQSRR